MKYILQVMSCDDNTDVELELNETELRTIERVVDAVDDASYDGCSSPFLRLKKVE